MNCRNCGYYFDETDIGYKCPICGFSQLKRIEDQKDDRDS